MSIWGNDPPWRQGSFLTIEALTNIQSLGSELEGLVAIVISHDCDLAQPPEREPYVEIVSGNIIADLNGSLANAKSTRSLHLTVSGGVNSLIVHLEATKKLFVPKELIAPYEPDPSYKMTSEEASILQRWLARRYRRAAFPTQFNKRLSVGNLARKLADKVKPYGRSIRAIYFDIDNGQNIERVDPLDNYYLGITIVYSGDFTDSAEVAAVELKGKLEKLLEGAFYDKKHSEWHSIELGFCDIASDYAVTIAQAMTMREWNLDYISLRDQSDQPIINE